MICDSVGSDGWIRFWFYETIDHADLSDDEQFLEIQPIYEFQIAEGIENAMLMSIQKQEPDNPEKTMWYAQVSKHIVFRKHFNISIFKQIFNRMEMGDCGYLTFVPVKKNIFNKNFLHVMLVLLSIWIQQIGDPL